MDTIYLLSKLTWATARFSLMTYNKHLKFSLMYVCVFFRYLFVRFQSNEDDSCTSHVQTSIYVVSIHIKMDRLTPKPKCEMLREKNDQYQTEAIKNVWAYTLLEAASKTKQSAKMECAKENYHLCTNFVRFGSAIYWSFTGSISNWNKTETKRNNTIHFYGSIEICEKVFLCALVRKWWYANLFLTILMDKRCNFARRIRIPHSCAAAGTTNLFISTNINHIDYIESKWLRWRRSFCVCHICAFCYFVCKFSDPN